MHADDSHNDKPGFFSKIFGHGDDAAVPTAVDPAASTPVADPVAVQPDAITPPAEEPGADLQATSMSDVHTLPIGSTEPLDLSNSPVAPAEPTAETFELPEIKAPEAPVESSVPVIMPEETPAEVPSENEEVLFDSTQGATPESTEVPAAPEAAPVAEPATAEQSAPEATVEPTPVPDIAPPAPPVEEGEAWSKLQADAPAQSGSEASPQAELNAAQGDMDTILSDHQDLTTDQPTEEAPAQVEPLPVVSPLEKDNPAPDPAPSEETFAQPSREAAVVRLKNHIDDLEAGLQKVRDELDALKA